MNNSIFLILTVLLVGSLYAEPVYVIPGDVPSFVRVQPVGEAQAKGKKLSVVMNAMVKQAREKGCNGMFNFRSHLDTDGTPVLWAQIVRFKDVRELKPYLYGIAIYK